MKLRGARWSIWRTGGRAIARRQETGSTARSGVSAQFPDDFDFEKFGEGTIELARSREHQNPLSTFPANFLSEWAKKDREGETSFYLEHLLGKSPRDRIIPFNDLEELMEAVFETSDVEEGASWVGRFIDGRELSRHDRRDLMSGLAGQEENGRLVMERLLQQEAGPAARSEKLGLFFESINSSYGREIDAFRVELPSGSSC